MRTKRGRAGLAATALLAGAACDPIDRASSWTYTTDWDCPAIACESLDGASLCVDGVCVNTATDADLRVAVRLPTTSNLAPGAVAIASPSPSPACPDCVSLPTSYTTEHGILVAREVAAQLGWSSGADVVVPAIVSVEPLVDGRFPLGSLSPSPFAPATLERWPRATASTPWRSPTGGEPVTSRGVLFSGTFARTLEPVPPFDSVLPPFADTLVVPPGEHMHAVGAGRLATVALPRLDLPSRDAGWTVYLADAAGVRRSSRLRVTGLGGTASFRIDAAASPDPFLLDLVVVPGDESLEVPRLVVPAPTALRRIAYPPAGRTSRVSVRVLDGSGAPVVGARVTLRMREIEQPTVNEDGVFASYAAATQEVVTDADGTTSVVAPYGNYTAYARSVADGLLAAGAELPFFFARESASITLRVETPRLLEGTCAFVGGKPLVGATIEALAIDDRRSPPSLSRSFVRTAADGGYRLPLPVGAFAFWLRAPEGAPMHDLFLGADAVGGASRTQLACRLVAPARRTMTILDAESPKGARVSSAIVQTIRLRGAEAPLWLGEAVTHPDGRARTYEAP
jgi:hypothetical protein